MHDHEYETMNTIRQLAERMHETIPEIPTRPGTTAFENAVVRLRRMIDDLESLRAPHGLREAEV